MVSTGYDLLASIQAISAAADGAEFFSRDKVEPELIASLLKAGARTSWGDIPAPDASALVTACVLVMGMPRVPSAASLAGYLLSAALASQEQRIWHAAHGVLSTLVMQLQRASVQISDTVRAACVLPNTAPSATIEQVCSAAEDADEASMLDVAQQLDVLCSAVQLCAAVLDLCPDLAWVLCGAAEEPAAVAAPPSAAVWHTRGLLATVCSVHDHVVPAALMLLAPELAMGEPVAHSAPPMWHTVQAGLGACVEVVHRVLRELLLIPAGVHACVPVSRQVCVPAAVPLLALGTGTAAQLLSKRAITAEAGHSMQTSLAALAKLPGSDTASMLTCVQHQVLLAQASHATPWASASTACWMAALDDAHRPSEPISAAAWPAGAVPCVGGARALGKALQLVGQAGTCVRHWLAAFQVDQGLTLPSSALPCVHMHEQAASAVLASVDWQTGTVQASALRDAGMTRNVPRDAPAALLSPHVFHSLLEALAAVPASELPVHQDALTAWQAADVLAMVQQASAAAQLPVPKTSTRPLDSSPAAGPSDSATEQVRAVLPHVSPEDAASALEAVGDNVEAAIAGLLDGSLPPPDLPELLPPTLSLTARPSSVRSKGSRHSAGVHAVLASMGDARDDAALVQRTKALAQLAALADMYDDEPDDSYDATRSGARVTADSTAEEQQDAVGAAVSGGATQPRGVGRAGARRGGPPKSAPPKGAKGATSLKAAGLSKQQADKARAHKAAGANHRRKAAAKKKMAKAGAL